MVLKLLKKLYFFKRKVVSNLFSTQFVFESYLQNGLKTCSPSKVLQFHLRETKVILFNKQNVFKPKSLARFCFRAFDFRLRSKFHSKIFSKTKMSFLKPSFKSFVLKKVWEKMKFDCKCFTYQMWMISNYFQSYLF
jgi:hypothetical protein